jgi:hypothetical protein
MPEASLGGQLHGFLYRSEQLWYAILHGPPPSCLLLIVREVVERLTTALAPLRSGASHEPDVEAVNLVELDGSPAFQVAETSATESTQNGMV